MNCIFREREGGEPPNVQQRVARSEDHHLPLGERRPRRKDRHQPLAEDSTLKKPPFVGGFAFISDWNNHHTSIIGPVQSQ